LLPKLHNDILSLRASERRYLQKKVEGQQGGSFTPNLTKFAEMLRDQSCREFNFLRTPKNSIWSLRASEGSYLSKTETLDL